MSWEIVIGLEVHTQLSTNTKIFSGASTTYGAEPNTQADAVSIALPGVLPVLNRGAVERAIKFGLAVGAHIAPRSVFARKNYFYPDLPKGYQISQFDLPVVGMGALKILVEPLTGKGESYEKVVRITRAHLEEDAGKSVHGASQGMTGVDLNRAGTPLLEIVSEPDMRSAAEAVAYAKDPAFAGALDRHLRRQHAGRLVPLRRERLGASPRRGAGYTPRDQKSQFIQIYAAGHRLRSAMADRHHRERRQDPSGDYSVQPGHRRDARDAQQGRRARLPLLPRPGPVATGHQRRVEGQLCAPRCRNCRKHAALVM